MMRKNIKRGAILSALLVVAFFLLYLVLLALRQRLKEIDSGEEEDAQKY